MDVLGEVTGGGSYDALIARSHVSAAEFAAIHAALGDREAALADLERAYDERSTFLIYAGVWPPFDPLRGEPRFRALMQRMGLPR